MFKKIEISREEIAKRELEAEKNALRIKEEAKSAALTITNEGEAFKRQIFEAAEDISFEAHLDWFCTHAVNTEEITLTSREKLRRLHVAIGQALEISQGARPGLATDVDEAMHKGDKIDLIFRFYSQKIADYKADESLDLDIKQAAILGLTEQMERQIQEISGAFESD